MTDGALMALKESVATLGESAQGTEGGLAVLMCAVAALVQTHPDAPAFAAAFRRAWTQLGSPNQALGADDEAGLRMRAVLDVLQDSCAAPLNVLPPIQ